MIKLTGIRKQYLSLSALLDIDLHFPKNQTTVLIGPSGCGKSTLLRLIAGLESADGGELLINDEPLTKSNLTALRLRMGYVIQEGGLFPHLSIRDNICIMANHLGWNRDKTEHRLEELAEMAHMPRSKLDHFPLELSGGQRQRVSLMRALMLDPDLLLLDEPLGSLDPMIRFDLQQELKEIFVNLNKTVIMVTHDIAEAAYFGHIIVLMRAGRIVQTGSLNQLLQSPADPFVLKFVNAQREPMQLLNKSFSQ